MGASKSKSSTATANVIEHTNANIPDWDATPKTSYHQMPETDFDDFEFAADSQAKVMAAHRISASDLFAPTPEVASALLKAIQRDRFVVLQMNDDESALVRAAYQEAKAFLELPVDRKATIACPHKTQGVRDRYSGYSLLHFDNCNSRRDPEERDVLQLRLSEKDIPWPEDGQLQTTACALYHSQFELSVAFLRVLAMALGLPQDSLVSKVHTEGSECTPDYSENTNLCFFRYYDYKQSYKVTQRCMVHQDSGFVTILPRATAPGIELFNTNDRVWVQPEQYLNENEALVYFGVALQHITRGSIPSAIHRVVREPQALRFSMPFEMKPLSTARLSIAEAQSLPEITDPSMLMRVSAPGESFPTQSLQYDDIPFSQLEIRQNWERVQRQVARADDHANAHQQQEGPGGTDMDA